MGSACFLESSHQDVFLGIKKQHLCLALLPEDLENTADFGQETLFPYINTDGDLFNISSGG